MPQLHLYLPSDKAAEVKRRASARGMSVSAFLTEIVDASLTDGWPEGYFETVQGGWQGSPLERPVQGDYEQREGFDVST